MIQNNRTPNIYIKNNYYDENKIKSDLTLADFKEIHYVIDNDIDFMAVHPKEMPMFSIYMDENKGNRTINYDEHKDIRYIISEFDFKNKEKDDKKEFVYHEETQTLFQRMKQDPRFYMVYLSPGGRGVRFIYCVENPITSENEYKRINKHYTNEFFKQYCDENIHKIDENRISGNTFWSPPRSLENDHTHINYNAEPLPNIQSDANVVEKAVQNGDLLSRIVAKVLPDWDYHVDKKGHYRGYCPCRDHKKSHKDNFDIYLDENDKIRCGCFHKSCQDQVTELYQKLIKTYHSEVRRDNADILDQIQFDANVDQIWDAFDDPAKYKLISSPTGSGKSFSAIKKIIQCIEEKKTFILFCQNRKDLEQTKELFNRLSKKNINELGIEILEQGIDISKLKLGYKKGQTPGVFSHHHYAKRKGIDILYYSILQKITKDTVIIFDEADTYINDLNVNIPLSARYKINHQGEYYTKVEKCPRFSYSGNCDNCYEKNYPEYQHNQFSILELRQKYKINVDEEADERHIQIEFKVDEHIKEWVRLPERNFDIGIIDQDRFKKDNDFEIHVIHCDDEINIDEAIRHMIATSFKPAIYRYYVTQGGIEIEKDTQSINSFDEFISDIKYPSICCNVNHLVLKDTLPIRKMAEISSEMIFLSATFTKTNVDFLKYIVPDLKLIKADSKMKMIDELLVIGVEKEIKFIEKGEYNFGEINELCKTLLFKPRFADAKDFYEKLNKNSFAALNKKNDIELVSKINEFWRILITYSRSVLSRGINLPEFDVCFVDTGIYLPSIALNLTENTTTEIWKKAQEDRFSTAIQNAGRILRTDKDNNSRRKVIVFEGIDVNELHQVIQISNYQSLVENEIQIAHINDDTALLKDTILEYLKTGDVQYRSELTKVEKTVEKAFTKGKSSLSQKERQMLLKNMDAKKMLKDKKLQKIVDVIMAMKLANVTVREIKRKIHYNRLSSGLQSKVDKHL